MKKQPVIGLAILILLAAPAYAAHFVCGTVNDASDGTSAIGMLVLLYYQGDPSNTVSCHVNVDNKYCCDAQAILGHTWRSGDVVHSRLVDSYAYVDGPVITTTTPGDPDVAPNMTATLAIDVSSPGNGSIIRANHTLLDMALHQMNQSVWYSLNGSANTTLCNLCESAAANLTGLDEGIYSILIYANNSFSETAESEVVFEIDAINDAPILNIYSPNATAPEMSEFATLEFSVNASDPNNYSVLSYYWYENGQLLGINASSYTFESQYNNEHSAGSYNITVNITDGEFSIIHSWLLTVLNTIPPGVSRREETAKALVQAPAQMPTYTSTIKGKYLLLESAEKSYAITRLEVRLSGGVGDAGIRLTRLVGKPPWLSYEEPTAYQWFEIEKSFDGSLITEAAFNFRVENQWMRENGLSADEVFLDIYNGKWERIAPLFVKQDEEYAYYTASVDHLSIVVIVGLRKEVVKEAVEEVREEPTPPLPPPVEKPKEIPIKAEEKDYLIYVIATIFIIIVTIFLALFDDWRIRKQYK